MSLATLYSRAQLGIDAPLVRVEVHLSGGLPSFAIVGMAETAVRESRERVRSALLNAGFDYPQRRITVNLSPADLPKEGGRYDLAIALGILIASNQLSTTHLDEAELFAQEIEKLDELKLYEVFSEEKYGNYFRNIVGIIEHAYYHLGQITLIKKMIQQKG